MTRTPPTPEHWHEQVRELDASSSFVQNVVRLWDLHKNTDEIAAELMQPERLVERALHVGLEHRRWNEGKAS